MPDEFAGYGREWAALHPDWEIRDWRSSAELPVLVNQSEFIDARKICPSDWKRFQADLLRLELMWMFGGLYVDCDVQPLKPFDDLLDGVQAFAAWSPNRNRGRKVLTQAVLGSVPMHPFFHWCMAELPDAVRTHRRKPLAQMIGPHHVDRVYRDHPEGLTVFDEGVFYPQANVDRDRGRTADLSGAYAWHRWANTRDNRRGGIRA